MKLPNRLSRRSGFTLIELLVVISIIAILSSIILAALGSAESGAKYASVQESLTQMRTTYELQYTGTNTYLPLMPSGIFGTNTTSNSSGNYACNTYSSVGPYYNYCNVMSISGCQTVYAGNSSAAAICKDILTKVGSVGSFWLGVIGGTAAASPNDYAFAVTNPSNTSQVFCIRSNGANITTTSGFNTCLTRSGW